MKDRVLEILDKIETTTETYDSFLFELRAALEAHDKGRIIHWTGVLAKYVGELTSVVASDMAFEFVRTPE
jgi:hypothetical protein